MLRWRYGLLETGAGSRRLMLVLILCLFLPVIYHCLLLEDLLIMRYLIIIRGIITFSIIGGIMIRAS